MSDRPIASVRDRDILPPPPRVLFVINDLTMGGAQRSFLNFVNHLEHIRPVIVLVEPGVDLLDELNPDLELVSLADREQRPMRVAQWRTRSHPPYRRIARPRGRVLLDLPGVVRKARRLARLARDMDTPIVSTFLNRSHTLALLAKFLFAPRLRIVINIHEVSGHVKAHFAPGERQLMRTFIKTAFPRAERIVAVSDSVRDDLVSQFSIPLELTTVVPNPIPLGRIRQAGMETVDVAGRDNGSFLIVAAGRLVHLKGFDVLFRAFARLPDVMNAKLILIGEGEERPALERLATELHIDDRVELVGNQVNPWKYMARADVIAVPSRTEAFPNVIGEAFALSVPVVASRCFEGVSEYLDGGRCGLLIPPDDAAALAEALERILRDPELGRQLAQRGARRVETFDLPRVVRHYERLLSDLGRA